MVARAHLAQMGLLLPYTTERGSSIEAPMGYIWPITLYMELMLMLLFVTRFHLVDVGRLALQLQFTKTLSLYSTLKCLLIGVKNSKNRLARQ